MIFIVLNDDVLLFILLGLIFEVSVLVAQRMKLVSKKRPKYVRISARITLHLSALMSVQQIEGHVSFV